MQLPSTSILECLKSSMSTQHSLFLTALPVSASDCNSLLPASTLKACVNV